VQSQLELMPTPRHSRALVLSRPAVIVALAIAFSFVLATGLLTAFSTRSLAVADRRAAQARRTLDLALQFLTTVSDAAVAARSAILTGHEPALARYRDIRERQHTELAALQSEFAGQDNLAPLFTELHRLADDRLQQFDRALAVGRERGTLPALAILDAAETAQPADEIRLLLAALQRRELGEQTERAVLASSHAATLRTLNFGVILIAVALAASVVTWLLRRVRDLEKMVTVCAWTRRVLWQGQWISFEEYLVKRFDLRCTHGICDEAAARMKADAARIIASEPRRRKRAEELPFVESHSTAPFA
jgi:CHASE3 domain sensor protein